jgi:ABC-type transport system substrate-binding protein
MENQLPKIGIKIDFHESTGLGNIAPRTWSYPYIDYDYIPTYDEGGFDIYFNKYFWEFEPNIEGMFDSAGISSPIVGGWNFYQYINIEYDIILNQYLNEHNQSQKYLYLQELQSILYEDLPALSVFFGKVLYGKRDSITGIDWDLLYDFSHRSELWEDTDDQILKAAIPCELETPNIFLMKTYDVYYGRSNKDAQWMGAVYGKLFQREQTSHYWIPEIASNYSVSHDFRNYTISIDPNAKFSDGNPVLAEDIKYSYELLMTPSVYSPEYSKLLSWFTNNQSIEIVDTYTINFNFSRYCYKPFQVLSKGIIDKSQVEPLISAHGYSIFSEMPLTAIVTDSLVKSCGPFKLESYAYWNNNTAKLVPNIYWNNLTASRGEQPNLKEYYQVFVAGKDNAIEALGNGEIDIVDYTYFSSKGDYENNPNIQYILAKNGYVADMSINMRHPYLGTGELVPEGSPEAAKLVRKAISHAVPRSIIVEQIYDGIAAPGTSIISDRCVGFNESLQPYEYSLDLARTYMELAGFDLGLETKTTSLTILISMILGLTIVSLRKRRK